MPQIEAVDGDTSRTSLLNRAQSPESREKVGRKGRNKLGLSCAKLRTS